MIMINDRFQRNNCYDNSYIQKRVYKLYMCSKYNTNKTGAYHSRGLGTFLPKKINGNLVHLHNHNHTPYVYSQIRQRLSSSEAVYKLCYFVAIAYYEGKSIQEGTYGHIYGVCLHNCTIKYRLFMLTSSDSNKSSDVRTQ